MHFPIYPGSFTSSTLICLAMLVGVPRASSQAETTAGLSGQAVWMLEAKGRVEVLQADRRRAARLREALVPADRVQTWTNSVANLLWYGRVDFQVSELSEILIPPPPGPNKRSTLEVLKGFLYFFHRGPANEIEIKTPTAAAIVVGTEFSVRVAENGGTILRLFDGNVEVSNAQGRTNVTSGQQVTIEPGQAPVVTPMLEGVNDLIQWFLYYPGVLNLEEAGFTPAEEQMLAASFNAYRSGDLREALARYPKDRQRTSDAEKIYHATLLLAVGQVEKAEAQLDAISSTNVRATALAAALRKLIATVKGETRPAGFDQELATAWLVESYSRQSRGELARSLAAATNAVMIAPQFGFGWERVAELEFSFGHTRQALEAVDRALKLSPHNAQALALKGFLLSSQNKISRAIEFFDQAVAQDGGLGNAWLGRGLCRIRQGAVQPGRQDLLVAAAVEPQRSLLRSYLGKALADTGDRALALHELELARQLDPRDPTGPLYAALLKQQYNQINAAVQDLETSQQLNENRRLYRSRLLLDQDRAVRSANLANIYQDNGMTDVSVREATRAVNFDYANYSAHLFLANSYGQLTDPKQVNLRYETAAFSEYLVASLLAPVGAGVFSPSVSQQEYSKLFEREGAHFSSATEYLSRGAWHQSASQYGLFGNTSYSLEADYLTDNGQRPNNDFERRTFSLLLRQQVSSRDTLYLQAVEQTSRGGDVAQYYDPAQAAPDYHFDDKQQPVILGGWHREWSPESHTLLVAARLDDVFKVSTTAYPVLALDHIPGGAALMPVPFGALAALEYRNHLSGYSVEGQHIWQQPRFSLIVGGRCQTASYDTDTSLGSSSSIRIPFPGGTSFGYSPIPASQTNLSNELHRYGAYAYLNVQPVESLLLSAGMSYDWLEFPANFSSLPISPAQQRADQLSPKVGLTWQPDGHTTLRGAYLRSLGSAGFENSYRIEPSQVAGFNQAFRSLAPEAEVGLNAAPSFENFGFALERRLGRGTYLGVVAELGREQFTRQLGLVELAGSPADYRPSLIRQRVEFEEPALTFTFNQLLGERWAVGAQYRVSAPTLKIIYPDLVLTPSTESNFQTNSRMTSTLHQVHLFARFNHPAGFFAGGDARWYRQSNSGSDSSFATAPAGDDFWQMDIFAGWHFARRRVEAQVGILNLTDQDYRLKPLNFLPELPRRRTFTASLRFNF